MVAHPNVTQKMIGATAVQILVIVELAVFIANVTDVLITGKVFKIFKIFQNWENYYRILAKTHV